MTKEEALIEHIKNQIEYHEEQEANRAKSGSYNEATWHNNRRGALEDLLIWVGMNELKKPTS